MSIAKVFLISPKVYLACAREAEAEARSTADLYETLLEVLNRERRVLVDLVAEAKLSFEVLSPGIRRTIVFLTFILRTGNS